jgi:hypothetical protein
VRTVAFRRLLDESNALRVSFDIEQGRVERFVVQFEGIFDEQWQAVMRYDTAHGFAHCDILRPYDDADKIRLETSDYNEALTYALVDLNNNWRQYRERYETWQKAR